MCTKLKKIKGLVILLVIVILVSECEGGKRKVRTKVKKGAEGRRPVKKLIVNKNHSHNATAGEARIFPTNDLLTLGKVLNFLPVGGERECVPSGPASAPAGVCLNAYDCRQRDGRAAGDCAHHLAVCCVFEVSCGGVVQNNLTYFMSPGFPEIWYGESGEDADCDITIEKTHAGIMQLRIDFIHFTIGQPNRTTGDCDEDAMVLEDGKKNLVLCGQNHGQHLYFGMSGGAEEQAAEGRDDGDGEEGELSGVRGASLKLRLRARDAPRLWLLRLTQLPLAHAAPDNCLQYYTHTTGTIKSFNYAVNGRHLSGQEYRACVRRAAGHCTVRYTPCHERAFRIEPGERDLSVPEDFGPGQGAGAGTGFFGQDDSFVPGPITATMVETPMMEQLQPASQILNVTSTAAPAASADDVEGSGDDPMIDPLEAPSSKQTFADELFQYAVLPPWMWERSARAQRWSPYAQHFANRQDLPFQYHGYGTFGAALGRYGRQRCRDRLTIPCENEYFVQNSPYGPGVCDPHHCGDSFCPGIPHHECRVETSVTPFAVSFHFGPPTPKNNPENNIGACIRYTQLPCDNRV